MDDALEAEEYLAVGQFGGAATDGRNDNIALAAPLSLAAIERTLPHLVSWIRMRLSKLKLFEGTRFRFQTSEPDGNMFSITQESSRACGFSEAFFRLWQLLSVLGLVVAMWSLLLPFI